MTDEEPTATGQGPRAARPKVSAPVPKAQFRGLWLQKVGPHGTLEWTFRELLLAGDLVELYEVSEARRPGGAMPRTGRAILGEVVASSRGGRTFMRPAEHVPAPAGAAAGGQRLATGEASDG